MLGYVRSHVMSYVRLGLWLGLGPMLGLGLSLWKRKGEIHVVLLFALSGDEQQTPLHPTACDSLSFAELQHFPRLFSHFLRI